MNKHKQDLMTWYSVNSISRSICRSKPFIPYKQRRSFSILKQLYREQIVFFDTIKRQIPKHTVSGFILRFILVSLDSLVSHFVTYIPLMALFTSSFQSQSANSPLTKQYFFIITRDRHWSQNLNMSLCRPHWITW